MKNYFILKFQKAEFLLSVIDEKSFPSFLKKTKTSVPEIIIAGRSNVGKSSLLNHLMNKKNLAKVSSNPGKTKTINFFKIDDKILLIDLPGYGYAKQSISLKNKWAKNIELFLNTRKNIKFVLLLLDIRRNNLSPNDFLFYKWTENKNLPLGIIFTKCDKKLKKTKSDINVNTQNIINELKKISSNNINFYLHYSIKENKGKKELISKLQDVFKDLKTWDL